jgi:hypothetical protein
VRLSSLTLAACALAPGAAVLACDPVSFGATQPSAEHAAAAALRVLLHEARGYESGGFVIEQRGAFRASTPVSQRSRSTVSYCIVLPRGATLAGLYHTHVGAPEFSPRDVHNSERKGVPSFIATLRDGDLLVYDPATNETRALGALRPPAPATVAVATLQGWYEWLDTKLRSLAGLLR